MDENRFIEAMPPLKRTISLNPENTDAHYSLGLVYSKLNHYQKAQDQFRQVLQMNPNHSGAYEKLAAVQKELEKETNPSNKSFNSFPKELDVILIP